MTPASSPSAARPHPRLAASRSLAPSRYEMVASWLITLLVLIGVSVAGLLLLWFSSRLYVPIKAVPVALVDAGGSGGEGSVGTGDGLAEPTPQQLSEQTDLVEFDLKNTVATIAAAVATQKAQLDDLTQRGGSAAGGAGAGVGGTGRGDGSGQGEGSAAGLSRAQRWEIRFPRGATIEEYGAMLDFFEIELGVVGVGPEITYLSQFARPRPNVRTAPRAAETRLYMSWRRGDLQQADRELAQRAGVAIDGKLLVQFFPPTVEQRLAELEVQHAQRNPATIRKTIFGVRTEGDFHEFQVLDQIALPSP